MERRALPIILIIILCCSLSFAVPPNVELPHLGIEFVLLVGLASVGIIALIYMLGSSLEMPALTALAKENLKELIVGAIIVILVWALVTGADTAVGAIFLQDSVPEMGADAIQLGHIYYLEAVYMNVVDAYHTIAFYQGFSYMASIGLYWVYVGQGSSPYFGTSILMGPLSNAINTLTVQILTFRLLKIFTYYVQGVFPTFVLPIALAFRLFPLTRKMGNTLIAICLGVMFVFPLSMVFMNDLWWSNEDAWTYKYTMYTANTEHSYDFDHLGSGTFADSVLQIVELVCGNVVVRTVLSFGEFFWAIIFAINVASACGPYFAACFAMAFLNFIFVIWPTIVTFIQLAVGGIILTLFAIDLSVGAVSNVSPFAPIASELLPAVAEATGVSLVSFFMIAFITFTGIKSISAALGGDYILYGVSRFI